MMHDAPDQQDCDVMAQNFASHPDSSDKCPPMQDCVVGMALYISNSNLSIYTLHPVRVSPLLYDPPAVFRSTDGLWRPPRLS